MTEFSGPDYQGWFRDDASAQPPEGEGRPPQPSPGTQPAPGHPPPYHVVSPPQAADPTMPGSVVYTGAPGPGGGYRPTDSTQAMPRVGADAAATQAIRPVTDADATRAITPQPPGTADRTQAIPATGDPTRLVPQAPPQPHDGAPTQAIPPVPQWAAGPAQYQQQQPPAAAWDDGGHGSNAAAILPGFGNAGATPAPPPPRHPQAQPAMSGGAPEDPGRRRRLALIGGAGVVAVIVVVLLVMNLGGGSNPSPTAQQGAKTTTTPTTGPGQTAATPSTDGMTSQAATINQIMVTSISARTQASGAVVAVQKCQNVPDDANKLRQAASQRDALVQQLNSANVSQIPGGAQLVTDLKQALTVSASSDRHFANWADAMASGPCASGSGTPDYKNSEYSQAISTTNQAGAVKKRVVSEWNPVAQQANLPQVNVNQI